MSLVKPIARAVVSPVARAVVSGIGGRSYADAVLSIPDLLGYWKFEADSWTPGNTAPVEVPNLVAGSLNTLDIDCQDGANADTGTRTIEPSVVTGPFGAGSYGLRLNGNDYYNVGQGGYGVFDRNGTVPPIAAGESWSYGVFFRELKARSSAFGEVSVIFGPTNIASGMGGAYNFFYGAGASNTSLHFYFREGYGTGANYYISLDNNDTTVDEWHQVVFSHDKANDQVYGWLDGVLVVDQDTSAWASLKGEVAAARLLLGAGHAYGYYGRFHGDVADPWISTSVLTDAQVQNLWSASGL